jgi:hypothetical protein
MMLLVPQEKVVGGIRTVWPIRLDLGRPAIFIYHFEYIISAIFHDHVL